MVENNIHAALLCFFTSLIGLRKEFKPRTDFRIVKMLLLLTDLHIFPADDFPPEKISGYFSGSRYAVFSGFAMLITNMLFFWLNKRKNTFFFMACIDGLRRFPYSSAPLQRDINATNSTPVRCPSG
ncbi:hypothetical protein Q4R30_14450 [Morganella morganii]|uniref:hypothetical protein n=1 Tax=Morganella morganii TaxID=582 RepID=UPI001FFDB43A|nr:hypothetical protein [Morganella morganii]